MNTQAAQNASQNPEASMTCPGRNCEQTGNSLGLADMSALWPDCRAFLRKTPLGNACRAFFNFEPNTVFLNHNAYGCAAKPGELLIMIM